MPADDFLAGLKQVTEARWGEQSPNPAVYGFQFQRGTRWNPGLSDSHITEYERTLEVSFPSDFKALLRTMNGTDLPTINIYGNCGEPHQRSVGVYSYPRDIQLVRKLIADVQRERPVLTGTLAEQGFHLPDKAGFVPIYGLRFLVSMPDLGRSPVLSIQGGHDAIVYGNSLQEYLDREFLHH